MLKKLIAVTMALLMMFTSMPFQSLSVFAEEESSSEFVSYTIEYRELKEDGTLGMKLFDSYVATLQYGTSFSAKVPSPTYIGYEPYEKVGDTYEPADEVVIEESGMKTDITRTIVYRPTEVKYQVRYFLQNIRDDLYTEQAESMETAYGKTGDYPDEALVRKQIDGFSPLYYQPEKIAADGSTVFQCYYDRNYYLINLNLDGGYGVEPVYARYGTPFAVNNPVKHGYVFMGWDLQEEDGTYDGVADPLPETVPMGNRVYKAIWASVKTTYTVVYWYENAEDTGYSYWGSEQKEAMSATYVDGEAFNTSGSHIGDVDAIADEINYFTFNAEKSDKNVLVEGDGSTVVNVYYQRNYYTITFKAPGLCALEEHTHGDGNCEYAMLCPYSDHEHTDACLSCTLEGHVHSEKCCAIEAHTHSVENGCWNNCTHACDAYCYGATETGTPSPEYYLTAIGNITGDNGPQNGFVYALKTNRSSATSYYLYYNDQWYQATGSAISGVSLGEGTYSTGSLFKTTYTATKYAAANACLHTHEDACSSCDQPEHTHDGDSCDYSSCTAHIHTEACYGNCPTGGHVHTSECYGPCIKPVHTHNNTCNRSTSTNVVKSVTRKYGASLADIWPVEDGNGIVYDQGQRWSPSDSSFYSQVLVYIANMPPDDFTLTLNTANYDTFTMHYCLESLDGNGDLNYSYSNTTKNFDLGFTVSANYNYLTKDEDFFDIKGFNQWTSNPTFRNNQLDINGGGDVYFYYERSKHDLQFYNVNQVVETEADIPYEAPLASYEMGAPAYPSTLEPNAYYFEGWYTTPQCFEGTKVNFEQAIMPDNNLIVYANWAPVERTVRFYNQYSDITGGETPLYAFSLNHGDVLTLPEDFGPTELTGLTFAGWFYLLNGEKVAFNPYEMSINRDLDIFAEWTSAEKTEYNIKFVLENNPTTEIAPPLQGYTFAGQTKTFTAKTGYELYDAYQTELYLPKTSSHSLVMDLDAANNTYAFEYVKCEKAPYTIRYVNKETGLEIMEADTYPNNKNAVVTAKFEPYAGYIPDAYYKRLVLSATESENVITFYYTNDNTHAYYLVKHMIENLDGTYSQYASIEGIGDLNSDIHIAPETDPGSGAVINPLTITGFSYGGYKLDEELGEDETVAELSKSGTTTVVLAGREIIMYYDRHPSSYRVQYLEYGTEQKLQADKVVDEDVKFGQTVTETALEYIENQGVRYELIMEPEKQIELRDEENVITFYYQAKQYQINYQAVCVDPDIKLPGYCGVSVANERASMLSTLTGSQAQVGSDFEFLGWYSDPSLEEQYKVTDALYFKPSVLQDTTYYAAFKPIIAELVIEKKGVEDEDQNQSFIFNIQGHGANSAFNLDVVVQGNGRVTIKDIPSGEYTITEITDWSWRYEVTNTDTQTCTVKKEDENYVVFENQSKKKTWLGGESSLDNLFHR